MVVGCAWERRQQLGAGTTASSGWSSYTDILLAARLPNVPASNFLKSLPLRATAGGLQPAADERLHPSNHHHCCWAGLHSYPINRQAGAVTNLEADLALGVPPPQQLGSGAANLALLQLGLAP